MPRSHLCVQCGFDLARIRAQRDPELGVWIVRCPECSRFAARRRRHPAIGWFRDFRKLDWTLGLLTVQTLMLFFCTLFSMMGVVYTGDELFRRDLHYQQVEIGIIYFVIPIVVGIWLTAGFPHHARWKVWIGWAGWIALLIALTVITDTMVTLGMSGWAMGNMILPTEPLERLKWALSRVDAPLWINGAQYIPWLFVVMCLGWPLGRAARWLFLTLRRSMFRLRLRRRRIAFQN